MVKVRKTQHCYGLRKLVLTVGTIILRRWPNEPPDVLSKTFCDDDDDNVVLLLLCYVERKVVTLTTAKSRRQVTFFWREPSLIDWLLSFVERLSCVQPWDIFLLSRSHGCLSQSCLGLNHQSAVSSPLRLNILSYKRHSSALSSAGNAYFLYCSVFMKQLSILITYSAHILLSACSSELMHNRIIFKDQWFLS